MVIVPRAIKPMYMYPYLGLGFSVGVEPLSPLREAQTQACTATKFMVEYRYFHNRVIT